jgi:hypothetical protein
MSRLKLYSGWQPRAHIARLEPRSHECNKNSEKTLQTVKPDWWQIIQICTARTWFASTPKRWQCLKRLLIEIQWLYKLLIEIQWLYKQIQRHQKHSRMIPGYNDGGFRESIKRCTKNVCIFALYSTMVKLFISAASSRLISHSIFMKISQTYLLADLKCH